MANPTWYLHFGPVYGYLAWVEQLWGGKQVIKLAVLLQDGTVQFASLVGGIPKIIHQSWSSDILPVKFRPWSTSLREHHPEWEWFLWTDNDNRDLVMKQEPSFLKTYDAFPHVSS